MTGYNREEALDVLAMEDVLNSEYLLNRAVSRPGKTVHSGDIAVRYDGTSFWVSEWETGELI